MTSKVGEMLKGEFYIALESLKELLKRQIFKSITKRIF